MLRFVQQAVSKGGGDSSVGVRTTSQLVVEEAGTLGRRKVLAGKEAATVIKLQDTAAAASTAFSESEAKRMLTKFQFPSKRWFDRIGQMSGGERRRLQLLQVLAQNPNVLLLDEPSNDLDLSTLTTLESYLAEDFTGLL